MQFPKNVKEIKSDKIYSGLFLLFFFSSLVLKIINGTYEIPGIVDSPQFGDTVDANWLKDITHADPWLYIPYYGFFIIDFVWAFSLLLIVWKFVKKKLEASERDGRKIWFSAFTIFVILAYFFDFFENCNYIFNFSYSAVLTTVKEIFYVLVGLVFIITLLRFIIREFLPVLRKFVVASIYSLLILGVIGVFLPTAPQVNSIVVDLYLKPWNFLILLLAAPIFASVLAHYPSYFNIEEKDRQWYMSKFRLWLFGIVHYRLKKKPSQPKTDEKAGRINFLFRTLGICFYAALFYMIAYTSQVNFSWHLKASDMGVGLLAIGILLLFFLKEKKDDWYEDNYKYLSKELPEFYDGDYTSKQIKEQTNIIQRKSVEKRTYLKPQDAVSWKDRMAELKRPHRIYMWLLVITLALHVLLFVFLWTCQGCAYSTWTVILSLACIVLQTFSYTYYRSFRSFFRFVFYSPRWSSILASFVHLPYGEARKGMSDEALKRLEETQEEQVREFFKEEHHPQPKGLLRIGQFLGFGALSNNVSFLQFNAVFGVINAIFFIIINWVSYQAVEFNAIIIILSALYLYYGVFVVLTKSFIYYKYSEEEHRMKNSLKFVYTTLIGFGILLVFNQLGKIYPNELFTLQPVDRKLSKEISLEDFLTDRDTSQVRYYIGCYGGGMKSNAWTLTVLQELNKQEKDFFKETMAISGASGGTMGWANMAAIIRANPQASMDERAAIIQDIATENILSIDLVHMLGRDTFNYLFVPGWKLLSGYDRSSKAMAHYARLSNNEAEIEARTPFREFWKTLQESDSGPFPILISNTTNVAGNHGMSVSVSAEGATSELLYQKADNILEIQLFNGTTKEVRKTLSYYDAVSTSNRFPLLSPAAKIETKGHYNDGGIYENSGLWSAFKLFEAVNLKEKVEDLKQLKQPNVFINIVNDKHAYIRHVLEEYQCRVEEVNPNSEINAILSSVASTEMMPIFIKAKLERLARDYEQIKYEPIYLPHRFTVADIKMVLGKTLYCKKDGINTDALLYKIVEENNERIEALIEKQCAYGGKPIIEPPMSRVMAAPAYEFMKVMLGDKENSQTLRRVISYGN